MQKSDLADLIEKFVNGTIGEWDWDDFISVKRSDPEIEEIRRRCAEVPVEFPPKRDGEYCSEEGAAVLTNLVRLLREGG